MLGVPEYAELGDAHLCARRMEVRQDHACDPVGQILDQPEMFGCHQRANVLDDAAVVDRIGDLAAGEHGIARNSDLDVQFDALPRDCFVLVQADPGVDPEFADEDEVNLTGLEEGGVALADWLN